ncbi:hypothetical protein PCI56_01740 [Plesiomonas shigelloides subsp. oncorhynchi]|nr:hypothetical protein [Plesiomonas shigelloides]
MSMPDMLNKTSPDKLIVRKIYKFMLGEQGEYIYQYGKTSHAPELSIKGKVDVGFLKIWCCG